MKIILQKQEILEKFGFPTTADLIVDGNGSEILWQETGSLGEPEYWTIIDDHKVKTSELIVEARKHFSVYVYKEEDIDTQFPAPNKNITRKFKASIEPDSETLGLSVNETLKQGITKEQGITLRERIIMEIDYFKKTGEHLDIIGWTLCTGSRSTDGYVPSVGWDPDDQEVSVSWYCLGNSSGKDGLRRAVSL